MLLWTIVALVVFLLILAHWANRSLPLLLRHIVRQEVVRGLRRTLLDYEEEALAHATQRHLGKRDVVQIPKVRVLATEEALEFLHLSPEEAERWVSLESLRVADAVKRQLLDDGEATVMSPAAIEKYAEGIYENRRWSRDHATEPETEQLQEDLQKVRAGLGD